MNVDPARFKRPLYSFTGDCRVLDEDVGTGRIPS